MARMNSLKNFISGNFIGRPSDDGFSEMKQINLRARVFAIIGFFAPLVICYFLGFLGIKISFFWQLIASVVLCLLLLMVNSQTYCGIILVLVFIALLPVGVYFLVCILFNLKFETEIAKLCLIGGGVLLLILIFPEFFKDLIKIVIGVSILMILLSIGLALWTKVIYPIAMAIGTFFSNINAFLYKHSSTIHLFMIIICLLLNVILIGIAVRVIYYLINKTKQKQDK